MKKTMLIVMMVIGFVLVLGCTTPPKPAAASTTTDDAFRETYNRYKNDLILEGAEKYTVVKGDMLSRISRTKYNNGFYFPVIMLASSDVVLDHDKIEPGMVLTIPNLQRNLDDPKAHAAIKKVLVDIAKIEDNRGRPQDADGLRNLANSL